VNDNINMDSTIAESVNDNINMDSTIAESMNDNINMDSTIAESVQILCSMCHLMIFFLKKQNNIILITKYI
jgi:hypothetical protein